MSARYPQIFWGALRLLWRFRLRSALIMFSAAIGVAGVVCSVNYGASGTRRLLDQIRAMGTNVLIVTPTASRALAGRVRTGDAVTTLNARDYKVIRREVTARTRSSAVVTGSFWLKAADLSKSVTVVGCEPDFFRIKNWELTSGDFFDETQEREAARVVLLGQTVARDLFGGTAAVGQRLLINRVPFTVSGILAERGQGLDVANEDNQVYVPLTDAMRRLKNVDSYNALVLEISDLSRMDAAAATMRAVLRQDHQIRLGRREDFQIQNQKTLLDTQAATAGRLRFFVRWIAASALLVSGFGMLGITWIAVKERTREIGTRRALGATAGDIFFQIIAESACLTILGCGIGYAISVPISRLLTSGADGHFTFDYRLAGMAFLAAAGLNICFSLWPSSKAAYVSPLAALRYE